MGRVHRYLLVELLKPFSAALLFLFQLLVAVQLLRGSEVIFGSSIKLGDFVGLIFDLAPHFLAMALPIAFLLGVLVGLGRLAEDRELLALSASGISPRVLLPVPLLVAAVLAAVGIFLGRQVEPRGLARVTDFASQALRGNLEGNIHPGVFFDDLTGLTLYAEEVDEVSHQWTHVMVHDDRDRTSPLFVLAKRGHLESQAGVAAITLRLEDGEAHRSSPPGSSDYSVLHFEKGAIQVGLGEAFFRRSAFRSNKDELTSAELAEAAEKAARDHAPNALELEVASRRRMASPLAPLAFALVAIPLAASLRRSARTVGFAMSGLCFGLYYVIARLGQQWGEIGLVGPGVAAHLPNLAFLVLGAALVLSSRVRS